MSKISIIIPVFNRQKTLDKICIFLSKNIFLDWELIVVDDGSSTPICLYEGLANDVRQRMSIHRIENSGPAAARNAGLARSLGGYIIFLDSDDLITDQGLAAFAEYAESERFDVIIGGWINVHSDGRETQHTPPPLLSEPIASAIAGDWPTGAVMLSRRLVSGVPEGRMPYEMAEFFIESMSRENVSLCIVQKFVVKLRQNSPGSLTVANDHFEKKSSALFWFYIKKKYCKSYLSKQQVDKKIFQCAFNLFHENRIDDMKNIYTCIDHEKMKNYNWVRESMPALFSRWFGPAIGFRMQHALHTVVRRFFPRK